MKKMLSVVISILFILSATQLNGFSVSAEDTPMFVASQVRGKPGDTVAVDILIQNNPGIINFRFTVEYDDSVLELISMSAGDFSSSRNYTFSPLTKNPATIKCDDGTNSSDNTTNGIAATLTFKILDNAPLGKSDIILTCGEKNVYNYNLQYVKFGVQNGFVNVTNEQTYTYGIFTYKIVDGEIVITDCDTSASGEVIVPDTISDYPVTTVSDAVFEDCDQITSVVIPKSVTTVGADVFSGCTALQEIIYTGSANKWDKMTVDSSNDVLNTVSKVYLGDLRFASASLTLYDDFSVNYKINKSDFDNTDYTDMYAVFEINGNQTTVSDYTEKDGKYIFRLDNIAPNQLNDTIYASLYATYNGTEYQTCENEYSVASYCYSMLNKYSSDTHSELSTLAVDLLNYGAKAQIYTGYKTDDPCNAALTDAQKEWATQNTPTLQTVKNLEYQVIDNPLVEFDGATLKLSDSVIMCFAITTTDSVENLTLKVSDGSNNWNITSDNFVITGDNSYNIYFDGYNASQMRQPVYVTVYSGETAISNTVCYSIESYAYEFVNGDDEALSNLLIDMMKYGDAAYAYAN